MKTTELITMLSRDATHAAPPSQKWLQVALLLAALAVTLGLTLVIYRLNPHLFDILKTTWFWLRFLFLSATGAIAWTCLRQLQNPGRSSLVKLRWLAMPAVAMGVIGIVVLMRAEPELRLAMILGTTWKVCSASIAFLSVPIFVSSVILIRSTAPTRLRTTGGVIGLFSGALAAVIYTLHCPELEPAFLVVWYGVGMLIPAGIGWAFGGRLLRW